MRVRYLARWPTFGKSQRTPPTFGTPTLPLKAFEDAVMRDMPQLRVIVGSNGSGETTIRPPQCWLGLVRDDPQEVSGDGVKYLCMGIEAGSPLSSPPTS